MRDICPGEGPSGCMKVVCQESVLLLLVLERARIMGGECELDDVDDHPTLDRGEVACMSIQGRYAWVRGSKALKDEEIRAKAAPLVILNRGEDPGRDASGGDAMREGVGAGGVHDGEVVA